MLVTRYIAAASAILLPATSALNILLNNDDSWASANIREFYKALKAAGHKVLLVAPAVNQSGKGGTTVFTSERNLTGPAEFNSVAAGAPSFGSDPNDSSIWYYNGTPAACTFFALDYVVPRVWNGTVPDLLVSGPNEGGNLGSFLYTLSGTIGATYAAIERGIPGIAFSAANGTHRSYTSVSGGSNDIAARHAAISTNVVNQLAGKISGGRLLPLGYGINVNLPIINSTCTAPKYVISRLTGGAIVDKAVFNATSGLFTYGDDVNSGVNACINGDCGLPGETNVVKGCNVSLSVFTVDYDAPTCGAGASDVRSLLGPLTTLQYSTGNSTSSAGNSTSSAGNSTSSAGTSTASGVAAPRSSSTSSTTGSSTSRPASSSASSSTPAAASTNAAAVNVIAGGSTMGLIAAIMVLFA